MSIAIQKIKDCWYKDPNRGVLGPDDRIISVKNIVENVISVGPFYYYIIDFETMQMSHVSESLKDILGFKPTSVLFDDILQAFHPEDINFVAQAQTSVATFFYKNIKPENLRSYKSSFNFRIRLKEGNYGLFNHQALMLTLGKSGGYGKCLNIHTRIDHLTDRNNGNFSIISIDDKPSYLNMKVNDELDRDSKLSKKEIEILKLIADGFDTKSIAEKLFISALTVKKHRSNILRKSDCKNMNELVKISYIHGLI